MEFLYSIRHAFAHYARFEGRADRAEFWHFVLFLLITQIVLTLLDAVFFGFGVTVPSHQMLAWMNVAPLWLWGRWHYDVLGVNFWMHGASPFSFLFMIATILPLLAVTARRLHDTGRSGWWQLGWLVPVAGPVAVLTLAAQPGRKA